MTLLKFFTALVRHLLMHALENLGDLSAQSHGQELHVGAEAKTKAKDMPVESKVKAETKVEDF